MQNVSQHLFNLEALEAHKTKSLSYLEGLEAHEVHELPTKSSPNVKQPPQTRHSPTPSFLDFEDKKVSWGACSKGV
jgi:hypothetical protein